MNGKTVNRGKNPLIVVGLVLAAWGILFLLLRRGIQGPGAEEVLL